MTDERLRLSMPDDQVCEACKAVVLNMEAHTEWHTRLMETAKSRIDGVERRLTQKINTLAQQYEDLLGIEQRDREAALNEANQAISALSGTAHRHETALRAIEQASQIGSIEQVEQVGRLEQIEGALGRYEKALPGIYARLRGVEDELSSSHNGFRATPSRLPDMTDEEYGAAVTEMTKPVAMAGEPETVHPQRVETDGDLLARLGTDPVKWAEEFKKSQMRNTTVITAPDGATADQIADLLHNVLDTGTLIGWFANAIGAGHSEARSDAAERISRARQALVDSGYFTPLQVGDDIAPRIHELIAGLLGRRDQFLYGVASCGNCSTAGSTASLCPNHTGLVEAAREEVHGQ